MISVKFLSYHFDIGFSSCKANNKNKFKWKNRRDFFSFRFSDLFAMARTRDLCKEHFFSFLLLFRTLSLSGIFNKQLFGVLCTLANRNITFSELSVCCLQSQKECHFSQYQFPSCCAHFSLSLLFHRHQIAHSEITLNSILTHRK